MKRLASALLVITVAVFSIAWIGGCSHPASGPTVIPDSGIGGRLYVVDTDGRAFHSFAGVTVTLATPRETTTTDDSGNWYFRNLGFGLWHVTFSRPDLGLVEVETDKTSDFIGPNGYVGDPNWFRRVPDFVMGVVPKISVQFDSVTYSYYNGNNGFDSVVTFNYHAIGNATVLSYPGEGAAIYISYDSTFQESTKLLYYTFGGLGWGASWFSSAYGALNARDIIGAGFTKGSKVYAAVYAVDGGGYYSPLYGLPGQTPSQSWDTTYLRYQLTARGTRSNVLTFTVPLF
jgi:hypothetical protein